IGTGAAPHFDVEAQATTKNIVTEKAAVPRLLDRVLEAPPGKRVLAANVDKAALAGCRVAGDRHRFDDRERVLLHYHPVLESAGLGFVGVADQVVGPSGGVSDVLPLAPGREGGAAATLEAGVR